mmetsp:Transcript_33109/g.48434  ORF Transcript_33109/g.48434 Transcript_33109/m.48434 type:complete len:220 (+) Transcript_33109:750-1409(+)
MSLVRSNRFEIFLSGGSTRASNSAASSSLISSPRICRNSTSSAQSALLRKVLSPGEYLIYFFFVIFFRKNSAAELPTIHRSEPYFSTKLAMFASVSPPWSALFSNKRVGNRILRNSATRASTRGASQAARSTGSATLKLSSTRFTRACLAPYPESWAMRVAAAEARVAAWRRATPGHLDHRLLNTQAWISESSQVASSMGLYPSVCSPFSLVVPLASMM